MMPEEKAQFWKEVEEAEAQFGVLACITPERHKKRWEQKASKLTQQIVAAETVEQKEYLQQKLIELNQREQRKAVLIALVHSLLAQGS